MESLNAPIPARDVLWSQWLVVNILRLEPEWHSGFQTFLCLRIEGN